MEFLEQLGWCQGFPVIRDGLRVDDAPDQVSRDLVALVDHHVLEPHFPKPRQEILQCRDGRLDSSSPVLLGKYAFYVRKDESCIHHVPISACRHAQGKEIWGQTSIEAVAISARAADALIALSYKKVDLFDKRSSAPFVFCTECAQWGELCDRWCSRWYSIVQVVLYILSILCSGDLKKMELNLIQLVKLSRGQ